MAKRHKSMVQSLRNFVKCSADGRIAGNATTATANSMGAAQRKWTRALRTYWHHDS